MIAGDGAGVVHESADPAWKQGDEVVFFPTLCDWECEWCRAGENVACPHFGVLGEHSDGAACELMHIDARNVFHKPAGLTWEEAAAFPLTFLTAWRMLTTRAQLRADETVLVIGAGAGVAVAAIQIAKHIGARVLVTSRSEAKRKRALELGADLAFDSAGFSKAVREATGDGVNVVFEHVGPATLDESMRSLALGGRIVTCGSTSGVKAEITMPRLRRSSRRCSRRSITGCVRWSTPSTPSMTCRRRSRASTPPSNSGKSCSQSRPEVGGPLGVEPQDSEKEAERSDRHCDVPTRPGGQVEGSDHARAAQQGRDSPSDAASSFGVRSVRSHAGACLREGQVHVRIE